MQTVTIPQALQIALEHHQAGRTVEAEQIYQQILQQQPNDPNALHLLGLIHFQRQEFAEAVELIERAVAAAPAVAEFRLSLASALMDAGKFAAAIEQYRAVLAIRADLPEAHNRLGSALLAMQRPDEALDSFDTALRLRGDYPEAHSNRGAALKQLGRLQEAGDAYQTALRLRPNFPEALSNLGELLRIQGRPADAIQMCYRALQLKSDLAEAYNTIGNAQKDLGQLEQALHAYEEAIRIRYRFSEAHNNLGVLLRDVGSREEALTAFIAAALLQPDLAEGPANAAGMLRDHGSLHEAIDLYRKATARKPAHSAVHSEMLCALHLAEYFDERLLYDEHTTWARIHADPLRSEIRPHANERSIARRLKLGFISDFPEQSAAFLLPLLENLDRRHIEVTCYSSVARPNALTSRFRAASDAWTETAALSDADLAELIRRRQIDILVDLSGHRAGNRLLTFARKPAPVQVSYLGYSGTTGLSTIHYRITDALADPPGSADEFHTEKLVRLPGGFLCYAPPAEAPPVAEPRSGHITFGCFNNFGKIRPRIMTAWARILNAVPESRLIVKSEVLSDPATRAKSHDLLNRHGVPPNRLTLLGPDSNLAAHLARYNAIDIALDTFPYNGTATTCEALWMGAPVITLRGHRHAARIGADLLHRIGLDEFVASSYADYERLASELALDRRRLAEFRSGMRQRMTASPLMDAQRLAKEVLEAFRWMWRTWCEEPSAQ